MNELNYASLEASKKLHEAGIVLETDALWSLFLDGFHLIMNTELHPLVENYPAPSIAEVWRELPEWTECIKQTTETKCVTMNKHNIKVFFNTNPADALIDLLIWARKEKS